MKKRARTIGLVAVVAVFCSWGAPSQPEEIELPAELVDYKEWRPLGEALVSLHLWYLCRLPSAEEWESERKKHGPHTGRWIRVYGNELATEYLTRSKERSFPAGSIVAKEKLRGPDAQVDGVAFMVKREPPLFSETGGWEFLYYPSNGEGGTHESCAACHRSAPFDYVFGQYPAEEAAEQPDRADERRTAKP